MRKKIFNILLQYFIRKYKKRIMKRKILAKLFFTENIFSQLTTILLDIPQNIFRILFIFFQTI